MAYDGIQNNNRVDSKTERKLRAKVVDTYLNSRNYFSRLMGMAQKFSGKTHDINLDIAADTQFEYFQGLEQLNAAANDTTIMLSYAHAAATQPEVSIMLDSFANSGDAQTVDLDQFNHEKASRDMVYRLGSDWYTNTGANKQFLGSAAMIDDGSVVGTIGGQSRATYPQLNAVIKTASGGILTLAKLADLHDSISASGMADEEPNINVTSKAIWSLYEQLHTPTVRADYNATGYASLPIRASSTIRGGGEIKGGSGFTSLTYRGLPVIKDDGCPAIWNMYNERYFEWRGRTEVPTAYAGKIEKVSLGEPKTIDGMSMDMPSQYNGFFFQKREMLPNQAGMVGRFFVIGQLTPRSFRHQGQLKGITGV